MKRIVLLLFFFAFSVVEVFGQCAMCKAVAEEQSGSGPSGINTGIMYIMIIPYIILFIFFRKKIFGLFRELKAAKRDPIKE